MFNSWKQYTRLKIDNNNRKIHFEKWLKRGYQREIWRLFMKGIGG
jgi:hypothetical protein